MDSNGPILSSYSLVAHYLRDILVLFTHMFTKDILVNIQVDAKAYKLFFLLC